MKKLLRRIPVVTRYIDIVVDMYDYDEDYGVVASELLKDVRTFQPSINRRNKLSDEAFGLYTNFIESVLNKILSSGLKITKHYQSKKAYTYYIYVEQTVRTDIGDIKYRIIFRINNHMSKTFKRGETDDYDRDIVPVYKDVRIGNFKSDSRTKAMDYLKDICKRIHDGDETAFDDEFRVFE